MKKENLTQGELKEMLNYDADSGKFRIQTPAFKNIFNINFL
jgi:hypothetical protein